MAIIAPFPLFIYYSLPQTSSTSRSLIGQGTEKGLVVAYTQSHGKGRLNRDWISPEGNFYGTFFMPSPLLSQDTLMLPVMAHLIKTLTPYAETGLSFRWPNDLFWRDEKIGSVFLEREGDFALISVNLNLKSFPEHMPLSSTCLFEDPLIEIELPQFSDVLKEGLNKALTSPFSGAQDFCAKRLHGINAKRSFNTKEGLIEGVVKGLDAMGGILLNLPEGSLKTLALDDLIA